jgi:ABC-type multidrug transport system ATPase subunit
VATIPGAPVTTPTTTTDGEHAVVTRDLRKTYRTRHGRQVAVAGLDLRVPVGGVHGFLGPNGSGKTTTIRMLLGLVRADAGEMSIFGRPVPDALPDVVGRIGAIVESPKFFPAFSGRKNLSLLAEAIGTPTSRVEEVLTETGLRERGRDRYQSYSLGMKQRLAIAATLLKSPDLLIFDEPTNGLDPAGIHEIRQTIRGLGERGRTVLVSSHILAEVEQVADTVSIIGRGHLLTSGPVAEVIGDRLAAVRVVVPDLVAALEVLAAAGMNARADGPALLVEGEPDPGRITYVLARQGIYVQELVPQRAGLEAVFLDLTRGESLGAQRDGTTPGAAPPGDSPPGAPAPGHAEEAGR